MKNELFNKHFNAGVIRNIRKCPKCQNDYSNRYEHCVGDSVRSYRPFLLNCGHTICENCIVNNRNKLQCPCCTEPVDIKDTSSSKFYTINNFDLNFFLIGEGNHLNYHNKSGSNSSLLSNTKELITTKPHIKCEECAKNSAAGICRQCDHHFCKTCFVNVHVSNVLRKHTLEPLNRDQRKGEHSLIAPQTNCSIHNKVLDRYCVDCDSANCCLCSKSHKGHNLTTLMQENGKYTDEVFAVLESIKTTEEKLQKAHKDINSVATQLASYARSTVEDIAEYFLELHSFLQIEQRRILKHMHQVCQGTEHKIVNGRNELNESQKILRHMEDNLMNYKINTPKQFLLKDLIKRYNKKLEILPAQLEISKITTNPFYFQGNSDYRKTISSLYSCEYYDPKLTISIDSMYDSIPCSLIDMEQIADSSEMNISNFDMLSLKNYAINMQVIPDHSMVRISHIISPNCFYIQKEDGMHKVQEISYVIAASDNHIELTEATIGEFYAVFHMNDNLWYRAVVEQLLPKGIYEVLLLDIGIKMKVDITSIFLLDQEHLKIPFAARSCRLHNLLPADGKAWDDDAKTLIVEVAQNKPLQLQIFDANQEIWLVDLKITTSDWPYTLRNVFLYTGLAISETPQYKFQPKTVPPTVPVIRKQKYERGQSMRVKVIHLENPSNFYVIESDQIEQKNQLAEEINRYYEEERYCIKVIYMAPLKLSCVVYVEGVFYRGCIEEIMGGGNVRVRLVDEGRQVLAYWREIFEINIKFQSCKEFATRCTLADVEPLQKDNYIWTAEAIAEFKRYTLNPKLEISICRGFHNEYKVMLLIIKGTISQNVAALLVKNGHALCLGKAAEKLEDVQLYSNVDFDMNMLPSTSNVKSPAKSENTKKILKRTEIHLTKIVSPNEFYIQLSSLLQSIQKFHIKIQNSQTEIISEFFDIEKNWKIGDHCFVFITYKVSSNGPDNACLSFVSDCGPVLLRGKILSVETGENDEAYYDIFLRDCGDVVRSVHEGQLFPINKKWDRVADSVHRCHLASIAPTGGTGNWSKTSIDHFKNAIQFFQSLSATLQGKHDVNLNSTPIVLWGTIHETADPLAPSVIKHSNVNTLLVKAGLARLMENLDAIEQKTFGFDDLGTSDDEITLEEWIKDNIDEKIFEVIDNMNPGLALSDADSDDWHRVLVDVEDLLTTPGSGAPEAWLHYKTIEKTLFTAVPTTVGIDAIIYLHHASDNEFLLEIRKKLTANYSLKQISEDIENEMEYTPGQACVAMYHLDECFYRGIVEKRNSNGEYDVRFIDYGNVESISASHMRPFAPYPNLGCFASRYRLSGISPKNGASKYSLSVLDVLHKLVVGKLVTVRIEVDQLKKPIKLCDIRVGCEYVAEALIRQNLVDSPNARGPNKAFKNAPKEVRKAIMDSNCQFDESKEASDDAAAKSIQEYLTILGKSNKKTEEENFQLEDEDCTEAILKQMQLQNDYQEDSDVIIQSEHIMTNSNQPSFDIPDVQPPKKRMMFDRKEYTDFYREMEQQNFLAEGFRDDVFGDIDDNDVLLIDDCDPEVMDLEKSFSIRNWLDDNDNDIDDEADMSEVTIPQPKSKPKTMSKSKSRNSNGYEKNVDSSSDFDSFQPNNSSSLYSYLSGLRAFQMPSLPIGVTNFLCTVVGLVTPTTMHILPLLTEFSYREEELQRKIEHYVRESLPLDVIKAGTTCLARYTKDKAWYRAVILSHNPHADEATVLYADYLNVETLPICELKRLPRNIGSRPLRTFRVQLHGILLNSNVPQPKARSKFKKLINKKMLKVNVIKQCETDDDTYLEVELLTNSQKPKLIYQPLIDEGIFKKVPTKKPKQRKIVVSL